MKTTQLFSAQQRLLAVIFILFAAVTGVQAEDYITEVMVLGAEKGKGGSLKSEYRNKGWVVVDKDLNKGAGGWDVYIAYKTSSTAKAETGYITDICASDKNVSSFTFESRTYYRAVANSGFNGDLNRGAGGAYIYIYYTRERQNLGTYGDSKRVITQLSTTSSGDDKDASTGAISWRNSKYNGLCEMNRGAGGDDIYIQQHFTTQTLKFKEEPVFASELTFDGNTQNLIAKDTWKTNADYGTLKYRVNEGSWACAVPGAINVGSYKVEAYLDGTSVSGLVYADNSPVISKTVTINPPIIKAKDLTAVFNQGEKKVKLTWSTTTIPGNYNDFQWVVYRDGEKIATLNHDVRSYSDGTFTNESSPTYEIYYVSKFWDEDTKRDDAQATVTVSTARSIPVNNLIVEQQDDRIVFTWTSDGYSEGFGNQFWIYIDNEEDPTYKLKASAMQTKFRWEHRSTDKHDNRQNKVDEETGVPYTEEPLNACDGHTYRIEGVISNKVLNTYDISTKAVGNGTLFYELDASKGVYEGSVKLSWRVDLQGSLVAKTYIVERRRAEQENEGWEMLARMSTNDEYILYTDEKALPGVYYDYRITVEDKCEDGNIIKNEITDIGFAKSTGTVTGRIDFGSTGTAVQDVEVVMTKTSSEGDDMEQFHAMYFNDVNGAVTWQYPSADYAAKKFAAGNFSVQMWLFPETFNEGRIVDFGNDIALGMTDNGQLTFSDANGTLTFEGITLCKEKYNHVALTRSGSTLTCYILNVESNNETIVQKATVTWDGELNLTGATQFELGHFRGAIDEFRLWTRSLREADILENFNHLLVGDEKSLETYWTFDEGLRTQFFDYSRDGTNYRKHHGSVLNNAQSSNLTPKVLKLKAKTDKDGNYIIQGIPFTGEGSSYSVIPMLGIHEFNPGKTLLFIGKNALVHTANFKDVSSFMMSGHIYYAGTNVPVEGVQMYVDGVVQNSNGEVIQTNASGYYEMAVPIGKHFVEARLGGHTMVEGGRWPTQGTFYFDRTVQHDFADSTLVNFVGRVGGGLANDTLAVGFALSNNNIGRATIQLALNNESFSLNCADDHISDASANRTWESDTVGISSQTMTGTGYDAKYIYIRTDSLTGEFSAMLPPLKFKIKSLRIDTNPDIDFGSLPEIDLTNVNAEYADTLRLADEDGNELKKFYSYNTKMVKTYFAEPELKLWQMTVNGEGDAPKGVFGRKTFEDFTDDFGTTNINNIWTINEKGELVYTYDYPIYDGGDKVKMCVWGYEAYMNYDTTPAVADTLALDGQVVTISNEMSDEQMVVARVDDESLGLKPGDIYELKTDQLILDVRGKNEFTFMTGLPNIVAPYTRQLSMSMERNSRTYTYEGTNAIVLGSLTTGTNFVTLGPDKVVMVLRDPPGATSKTTWSTGSTKTHMTSKAHGFYGDEAITIGKGLGATFETVIGIGVANVQKTKNVVNTVDGTHYKVNRYNQTDETWSVTTTKAISTGTGLSYVGAAGDVYIGASTNIIVGTCRQLGFSRNGAGYPFVLDLKNAISLDDSITTTFMYSAYELEKVMIPKWENTRRSLLTFVKDKAAAENYINESDHCVYVTWLKEDDPQLGVHDSTYIQYGPKGWDGKTIYPDSVMWCTDQINSWHKVMADNEQDKLEAMKGNKYFKENISFDGGTSHSYSHRNDTTYQKKHNYNHNWGYIGKFGYSSETSLGGLFSKFSLDVSTENGWYMSTSESDYDENTKDWAQFDYSFSDGNRGTDFSVSTYKSPSGWSDSFFLVGGQSYNPYEGEQKTKYYEAGMHTLSNGTEQMEIPNIRISLDGNADNSAKSVTLSDVPAGQAGQFTLHLTNLSNTTQGFDLSYKLIIQEDHNQKGLEVLMDGIFADGRSILIPAGQTVKKIITVRQTDQSVLDYEDLRIRFASMYQPILIYDWVSINIHFQPSSSPIDMVIDDPILNIENMQRTKGNLEMKLKNFDRQFKGMKKLGVEYRYEGSTTWTQPSELQFVVNEADTARLGGKPLPATGDLRLTYDMSDANFYPQGNYTFRAYTMTMYGTEAVNVYSKEIVVVKDDVAPRQLTTPAPTNGILGYGDDLMVEFNEDIVPGYVSDKNIIVTAKLNSQKVLHDVAVRLFPAGGNSKTTNPIFLNDDFSIDFWMKWMMGGTVLSIGKDKFALSVDSEGHLAVNFAGVEAKSDGVIPKDTWTYVVLSYNSDEMTFSALAQYDETTLYLFSDQQITTSDLINNDYSDDNRLILGNMNGAIHDLSLFNIYRDPVKAAADKYQSKDNYVYGLVNYWPMNEGHGNVAYDTRHTHDMYVTNWLRENKNYALTVDEKGAEIDISQINTNMGDSYVVEMWYNSPYRPKQEQVVFEVGSDDSHRIGLYHNNKYDWVLRYCDKEYVVGNNEQIIDTDWNHVALSVVRGQSASFYFNGQRTAVIAEADVPPLQGAILNLAKGASKAMIDEVRIWHANLSESHLLNNIYNCIDTTDYYSRGLVAYYPFEKQGKVDGVDTKVETIEDMAPRTFGNSANRDLRLEGDYSFSSSAPPVKNAPVESRLMANPISSERKIVISLVERSGITPRDIEGTTLNITVDKIHDMHGNESEPIRWTAYVQRNALKWAKDSITVIKQYDNEYYFDVEIVNKGGNIEYYTLYNMPQWLSLVDALDGSPVEISGDVAPRSKKTLRFKVMPTVPVGNYDVTVGLQGNDEILEPLRIVMKVRGEMPNWTVNPDLFENSMSIVGQVYANGVLVSNSESCVAAFIDGQCRGVAYIQPIRGAAFVAMSVYGTAMQYVNGVMTDLDNGKAVTFRIWDASKGVAYSNVNIAVSSASLQTEQLSSILFDTSVTYGDFNNPVIFTKSNLMEQELKLKSGWNWMSLGVEPVDTKTSVVLKDITSWNVYIKDRSTGTYYSNGTYWDGTLADMHANTMYKMNLNKLAKSKELPNPLPVTGEPVKLSETKVKLKKNWNWISYLPTTTLTLDVALAGANPKLGDQVKSQQGFAIYGSNGWDGNLKVMESGKGYLYYSVDNNTKEFAYPNVSNATVRVARAMRAFEAPAITVFTPVAPESYSDNMSMVVKLIDGDNIVTDAELAAFVDGECRGAATAVEGDMQSPSYGLYYLLIAGEGHGKPMEIRAAIDGDVITICTDAPYNSDAIIGTPWEPYVIDLSTVGIDGIAADETDGTWYNLQGMRLGEKKPSAPGVYIQRSSKGKQQGKRPKVIIK